MWIEAELVHVPLTQTSTVLTAVLYSWEVDRLLAALVLAA